MIRVIPLLKTLKQFKYIADDAVARLADPFPSGLFTITPSRPSEVSHDTKRIDIKQITGMQQFQTSFTHTSGHPKQFRSVPSSAKLFRDRLAAPPTSCVNHTAVLLILSSQRTAARRTLLRLRGRQRPRSARRVAPGNTNQQPDAFHTHTFEPSPSFNL